MVQPATSEPDAGAPAAAHGVARVDVRAVNKKEHRSANQKRLKIYPKKARGGFRRLKWGIMGLTLSVYYLAPWLRWDRGANAPDQAILLDIPARRFYFFFIEIWPQEVYYLTGLLILAAFGLFLATSLFGRVWCGYTCPQTVWTDLFIAVERMVEGDRGARLRLDKSPWSAAKIGKRVVKHGIWLIIAMLTGGAWVFYFADAPSLLSELATLQAPPIAYIAIGVLTFTTYTL
ncbi:MAG: 4Fe-4S binding protein, partial [Kiloniellaceae bacterium]